MLPLSISSAPSHHHHHHRRGGRQVFNNEEDDDDDDDDLRPLFLRTTGGGNDDRQRRPRQSWVMLPLWCRRFAMTQRYYGTAILLMILGLAVYLTWSPRSGFLFYPRYNYYDDPYASTPFCNATNHQNGHNNCGEQPDLSSARTVYSAHSADQYRSWYEFQRVLQAETNELATAIKTMASSSSSLPSPDGEKIQKKDRRHIILFYGDSITEAMRGTAYGRPCLRCQGLADVAQDVFSSSSSSGNNDEAAEIITPMFLGISGDQTQHVLYRIAQNEAALSTLISSSISTSSTSTTTSKIRISFVILIGTNNLSVGISPLDTARGIRAVAQSLSEIVTAGMIGDDQPKTNNNTLALARNNNNVRILLLHVLPRGDDERLKDVCPTLCQYNDDHHPDDDPDHRKHSSSMVVENDGRPNSFLPWIAETNGYLVDSERRGALPPYVELLDCTAPFYSTTGNNNNNRTTMLHDAMFVVDRLHPNALGTRRFTECVMDRLRQPPKKP